MPIKIVTDSTSYMPYHLREEYDIAVVSLSVSFGSETYREEEIDNPTFYNKMANSKAIPTSSQPTPQELYNVFEKLVLAKHYVVGIFLSSDMSGTYSTALMVKGMILDKYPEAVIEIIDSRSNCMELGFSVLAAAKAAKSGLPMEDLLKSVHNVISKSRFLFVPETLEYLKKGGRIGGAAALLGTLLQIKPILTVIDGKTALLEKVRTKSRAVQNILDTFLKDIQRRGLGDVAIHHINNEAEGTKIALMIENKIGKPVPVYPIGPVIGLHVGPGTVGIVYYTLEQ